MHVIDRSSGRWERWARPAAQMLLVLLAGLLFAGCATNKINWAGRVGAYTYDQAITELGPPDKSAKLTDGTTVGEWLTSRGYSHGYYGHVPGGLPIYWSEPPSPDFFIRLTFGPDGKLKEWKKVVK